MPGIEIVTLPPEDWQRYRAFRLEMLQTEPGAFGSAYADMVQRPPEFWQGRLRDAACGERSWLLFAQPADPSTSANSLVGMIGAFLNESQPAEAEIISVYVSPAWRGQGVGGKLFAAILDALRQQPSIRRAVLGVNVQQAAAVALYQRFGFQVIAQTESVMGDGQTYPGYRMEKDL